ncbi:MAG: hypothetical protein WDM90_17460 [Ferruginibacter sp.]
MQLNYYHRKERNTGDFDAGYNDSVVLNYKRNLTEIGMGYFHVLNKNAIVQVFGAWVLANHHLLIMEGTRIMYTAVNIILWMLLKYLFNQHYL